MCRHSKKWRWFGPASIDVASSVSTSVEGWHMYNKPGCSVISALHVQSPVRSSEAVAMTQRSTVIQQEEGQLSALSCGWQRRVPRPTDHLALDLVSHQVQTGLRTIAQLTAQLRGGFHTEGKIVRLSNHLAYEQDNLLLIAKGDRVWTTAVCRSFQKDTTGTFLPQPAHFVGFDTRSSSSTGQVGADGHGTRGRVQGGGNFKMSDSPQA